MAEPVYKVVITPRAEAREENELLVLVVEVDHAKRDPEKLKEQFGR